MTPYSSKIDILAEVFSKYKHQPVFSDFYAINDLGLPLAWLQLNGFVSDSEGTDLVEETWHGFCQLLDLDPEAEWDSLDAMFIASALVKVN